MKSLSEYVTEAIERTDPKILRREYRQAEFPRNYKAPNPEATMQSMNKTTLQSIAKDIFGCRYGNLKECSKMPEYNMFNAMHVKQMVFNTKWSDEIEKHGIALPIKYYISDPDLGPQMIYYLTESGEKLLQSIL